VEQIEKPDGFENSQPVLRAGPSASVRQFGELTRSATPRVVVTPLLVLACVGVFVVQVASGVSPVGPDAQTLFEWGGGSGVAVALDGEGWRLLTAMFLHAGFLHLGFNAWCLAQVGPLAERLFGNLGFAGLYLLAGLGGSLASAWWDPLVVGVGASGAVFGVIGGLMAFLFVHREAVPPAVLAPLRSSTTVFVAYNLIPGMFIKGIDNAAHVGGLATGLLAGFLLSRPWPAPRPNAGLARQLAGALGLAAGLSAAGWGVTGTIRRNPEVVAAERSTHKPADDYNAFMGEIRPHLVRFDQSNDLLKDLLRRLESTPVDGPQAARELAQISGAAGANLKGIQAVRSEAPELQEAGRAFAVAQSNSLRGMEALARYLANPSDDALIGGPEGFLQYTERSSEDVRRFEQLLKDYRANHEIVLVEEGP